MKAYLVRIFLCLLTCALVSGLAAARTIEFETTEVTQADVTLSPDGKYLIFTMLGHLFRLPVAGGTAEQLIFGPYYDSDPVFSPDGNRVAFVSDRDGNEGNVFVLELATGQITQVTHEPWAGRPTWTPDGQAIVYLSFPGERSTTHRSDLVPALVRRVSLGGGEPETLSAPHRLFRSVFYLPDGRLAWMVVERESGRYSTHTARIEVMSPQGTVSIVRTLNGDADRAVPSPAGDGLYWRRRYPRSFGAPVKDLSFVPLPDGAERQLLPVSGRQYWDPQFAVAADNRSLYLGENGRLWKIALPSGAREHLAFRARVKLEIQDPVPPARWAPAPVGGSAPPRSVLWPRLSPDGRTLVFGAAGYLWQQRLDQGQAQRLFAGSGFESEPSFSPDGRQLAFVHRQHGKQELRVFDFDSRQTRTLASAGPGLADPSWSPDGQRLVFWENKGLGVAPDLHNRLVETRMVAVNVNDGKKENLSEIRPPPRARPHFSVDGQSVYFSDARTTYRLPLVQDAKPHPILQMARPWRQRRGLVSPDGKWLAFGRTPMKIWVAPLGKELVKEENVPQFSSHDGGWGFAFTPDSSALIYSTGNRVWRQLLAGGEREEIAVRLELERPTPPPVLVRRVRVLDFAKSGFGPETSLFIEQGRIRWMGSERDHELPRETVIVEAGGRFAIPGLFDMHVHSARARGEVNQEAFLAYGVTSVRDMGDWLALENALVDRSETTNEPVPRYFFTGDYGLEECRGLRPCLAAAVVSTQERGSQFIKAYIRLSWPARRAVSEEARRLGLPVAGHNDYLELTTKSVTLGYASLEHIPYNDRLYDDVLQMLALAGTRWDPTLAVRDGNARLLRDEPERLADAKLRAFTPEWQIRWAWASAYLRRVGSRGARGNWVERLASIRAAHRRGVRLLTGTDAPTSLPIFSGVSLHWELEYFVQAGIPPLDVLRIATQEGAAAVGADDDLGTLEPGKLADLVLLDANPLEDIRNTQTIWRVIKGGWVYDPKELAPPGSTYASQ